MPDQVVNIAFISDDNYVAHLAVTIISMLEHVGCNQRASEQSILNMYVMDAGITPASRDMFLRSIAANARHCRLRWSITFCPVSIPESLNLSGAVLSYFNRTVFAKLYLTELLPPQVQRVIFLDSDLLVLRDVMDLWLTDIRGKVLAAARDSLTPEIIGLLYPAGVDWKREWKVANAGVMILDVGELRHRGAHADLLNFVIRHRLPLLDQDAWNLYCQGDWFELDGRWNVNMMGVMDQIASTGGRGGPESPFVAHFCGKPKPWDCKLRAHVPWVEQYFERLATTEWDGAFPQNECAERMEAEKCVFALKIFSRCTESRREDRRLLTRLHEALVHSIGPITNDLTRPELTAALNIIKQRATIGCNLYEQFDRNVFRDEVCRRLRACAAE